MNYKRSIIVIIAALVLCSQNLFAQELSDSTLVGKPAPPIRIQKWLKGKPVAKFERGHVYVVEFSGVGCPPCRKAIPHLTELAHQYDGKVTIVSIYSGESNTEASTDLRYLDKIEKLVNAMADKMDYTVVADVPAQTTADNWGVTTYPTIFIVDQSGNIAWSGSNSKDLDAILPRITRGTFNAASTQKEQKHYEETKEHILKLKESGNYLTAERLVDSLINVRPEDKAALYFYKFKILIGSDDAKAYTFLQWLLDNSPKGFVWDKFLYMTWQGSKKPDYDLALKTADKALATSETSAYRAYVLIEKARIYDSRAKNEASKNISQKYLQHAVMSMEQALKESKSYGDQELIETTENEVYRIKFNYLVHTDQVRASALLREMLDRKLKNVEWISFLREALSLPKWSDYDLLLEVCDYARKEEGDDDRTTLRYIRWKAEIYGAKGEIEKALNIYRKAYQDALKYADRRYEDGIRDAFKQ